MTNLLYYGDNLDVLPTGETMPIRNNVNTLEVPDPGILKEFLAHARKVWTAAHPDAVGRRGRPSEQKRVFDACAKIWQDRQGKHRLTQGQFIRAVQEMFGEQSLHPDTIERHVKEWICWHLTLDECPPSYLKKPEVQESLAMIVALGHAWTTHLPAIQSYVASLPPGTKLKDIRQALDARRKLLRTSKSRRRSR